MKTIIPIPKPLSYFLIGIFITTAVIVVVDVIKSTNNWKKELDKFKSLRINSLSLVAYLMQRSLKSSHQ